MGSMFRIVFCSFLLFCLPEAIAEKLQPSIIKETNPVKGDPFKDFRIQNCPAIRGVAIMQYDSLGGPFVISDFCIDEENARFIGPEIKAGFEQVSNSRAGRKFDIPSTRNRRYQPTSFTISRSQDPVCKNDDVRNFDYILSRQKLKQYPEFNFAYARGFTYKSINHGPIKSEPVEAMLSFTLFNQYDISAKRTKITNLPTGITVYSKLELSGSKGFIKVIEGDGYNVGNAEGTLSLHIEETGAVRLSGAIEAKSLNKHGQGIGKWTSISGKVIYFRGYVIGETAKLIRGYGLFVGNFKSVTGQVYPIRSDIEMYTCFK